MKNLIKIRFLQLYRELVKAGWWASSIGVILFLLVVTKILKSKGQSADSFMILYALISIILSIQFIRKDKRILSVILPEKFKFYYLLEYFIFSLPFVISCLIVGGYLEIIMFYIFCFTITQLDLSVNILQKNRRVLLAKFIDKNNFEWLSGMRRMQYAMIIMYIFCVVISYWHFAGFICLGVVTFLFSSCYNECESQFILTLHENDSENFIKSKIKKHLVQYFIFILPILLIYFIHYPEKWIFYVPLIIVYLANYLVYILNKYKSYVPNQTLQSNSIIVAITFAGMFIPYLFPISLILVFVFYSKAIHNLKPYFNA